MKYYFRYYSVRTRDLHCVIELSDFYRIEIEHLIKLFKFMERLHICSTSTYAERT